MGERKLDLFERGAAIIGETGIAPSQVVRSDRESSRLGIVPDGDKDALWCHRLTGNAPSLVHRTEERAGVEASRLGPCINRRLGPRWHRNSSTLSAFSLHVQNDPPPFPFLNMLDCKRSGLFPAQPTAYQHGQ